MRLLFFATLPKWYIFTHSRGRWEPVLSSADTPTSGLCPWPACMFLKRSRSLRSVQKVRVFEQNFVRYKPTRSCRSWYPSSSCLVIQSCDVNHCEVECIVLCVATTFAMRASPPSRPIYRNPNLWISPCLYACILLNWSKTSGHSAAKLLLPSKHSLGKIWNFYWIPRLIGISVSQSPILRDRFAMIMTKIHYNEVENGQLKRLKICANKCKKKAYSITKAAAKKDI